MVHKVLVLIDCDREYNGYLYGYIEESDEAVEWVEWTSMEDAVGFSKKVVSLIPDYRETDSIDLYLAQADKENSWGFEEALRKAGAVLSGQSRWSDEDAYRIIKEIPDIWSGSIVLRGKEKSIGCEAGYFKEFFYRCNYEAHENACADKERGSSLKEEKIEQADGRIAPLFKLMRQLEAGAEV